MSEIAHCKCLSEGDSVWGSVLLVERSRWRGAQCVLADSVCVSVYRGLFCWQGAQSVLSLLSAMAATGGGKIRTRRYHIVSKPYAKGKQVTRIHSSSTSLTSLQSDPTLNSIFVSLFCFLGRGLRTWSVWRGLGFQFKLVGSSVSPAAGLSVPYPNGFTSRNVNYERI